MTVDVSQAIPMLQDALLRQLGDEVELIFRYGSHLKGSTHHYSDLDISYVPVHESTWNHITVLVDDTMIDLYPIHWSHLERMAGFGDVSCTVLLEAQIVYQRSPAAAARLQALSARLRALQQPDARPEMLRKAQTIFQRAGYPYYLLREQAANRRRLACLQHARQILGAVVHCLAVCNQACIDTRKLAQVLALPLLPEGFAGMVERVTAATDPAELLAACETLLDATRNLLLAEQARVQRRERASFPTVFDAAYPELKGDLQHLMLACERRDLYNFNLVSLYHELMVHTAQALTGIEYSDFNSLADYEQDLAALGFPDLLSCVVAGDFDRLHRQCQVFDRRLRQFLTERSVPLNAFATLDELQAHLDGKST